MPLASRLERDDALDNNMTQAKLLSQDLHIRTSDIEWVGGVEGREGVP